MVWENIHSEQGRLLNSAQYDPQIHWTTHAYTHTNSKKTNQNADNSSLNNGNVAI